MIHYNVKFVNLLLNSNMVLLRKKRTMKLKVKNKKEIEFICPLCKTVEKIPTSIVEIGVKGKVYKYEE